MSFPRCRPALRSEHGLDERAARNLLMYLDEQGEATGAVPDDPGPEALLLTPKQAARRLAISVNTVNGYVREVYRKLGISSRAEAALEATRRGLLD